VFFMSLTDPIKSILRHQKKLVSDLETEVQALETHDLVNENKRIKEDLDQTRTALELEKSSKEILADENQKLKNALYEQIYNEKMTLLSAVKKRSDLYFTSQSQGELNRLKAFEKRSEIKINELCDQLKKNKVSSEAKIFQDLETLRNKVITLVAQAQEDFLRQSSQFSKQQEDEYSELKQEKLSEAELTASMKKNNLESLIGLNLMSKLGILFLIIAVIALSRHGYIMLGPIAKGVVIYAIACFLLFVGEWLNRKTSTIFSIALTGGGVAILYVATSMSYLSLKILPIETALYLCVLITILAFILSIRYQAQTIAIFALIGGYLPIVTLSDPRMPPFLLMIYFFFLHLFLLSISTHRKWHASNYVGFMFNFLANIYLMRLILSGRSYLQAFSMTDFILLGYLFSVFMLYTLIPLATSYRKKVLCSTHDLILIASNTLLSTILLNITFFRLNLTAYNGMMAICFALIYFTLAYLLKQKMPQEKLMRELFYLTCFSFVLLFIPYQYDKTWLSLGWLVEGVVLANYGILKEKKNFTWFGSIAYLLCLGSFVLFDLSAYLFPYLYYNPQIKLFTFKYFAITLGSISIVTSLCIKKHFNLYPIAVKVFAYLTAINAWFFMLYFVRVEWGNLLVKASAQSPYNPSYLIASISIVLTFIIAYILQRIRRLSDPFINVISTCLHCFGIIWLFGLNIYYQPVPFYRESLPRIAYLTGILILVLVSILSLLALKEIVNSLIAKRNFKLEVLPLVLSAYFLLLFTQTLISQFNIGFENFSISLIYLLTALLMIIYGFSKSYALLRKYSLALTILAIGKLVFLDLAGLEPFWKIISYFAFGVFLLLISLVYQYFNKTLLQTLSQRDGGVDSN
jgi:hypothetical protein